MKTVHPTLLGVALAVLAEPLAQGQAFSSGSDGSYGALNLTNNAVITLDSPPNGIFNCTTITIGQGISLQFRKNALNTPVYLLATGDVNIKGTIDVSGKGGTTTAGGEGGPGGFSGGSPGWVGLPPGAGYGPGAGQPGIGGAAPGGGSYATLAFGKNTNNGATYGSPLLIPLVGGSGGGGSSGAPGTGGGGGGGAILIASNTQIDISGHIYASGGRAQVGDGGDGSGGAVRLVAPVVTVSGFAPQIDVSDAGFSYGFGRVRIDTLNRTGIDPTRVSGGPFAADIVSIGSQMIVFPNPVPRLDIVEAAGTAVPFGSGPVFVQLPFGAAPERIIKIQALDFNSVVPISLVLTPDSGTPLVYSAEIDNRTANPASVAINVVLPVSAQTAVNAWTR